MYDYPFILFELGENLRWPTLCYITSTHLKCPAGFGYSPVNTEDWVLCWDKKHLSKRCLFHISQEKIFYNNITNVKISGWILTSQGQNLAISSVSGDTEWIQHFSRSYTEISLKYLKNYLLSKIKQINSLCETQQTLIKSKTSK